MPEMDSPPLLDPNPHLAQHRAQDDAMDTTHQPSSSSSIRPDATSLDITFPLPLTTTKPASYTAASAIRAHGTAYPLPNHEEDVDYLSPRPSTDSAETIGRAVSNHIEEPASLALIVGSQLSHTPIKRKPLSARASALATNFVHSPSASLELPKPEERFSRSPSVDSPILYGQDQDDNYAAILEQLPAFE